MGPAVGGDRFRLTGDSPAKRVLIFINSLTVGGAERVAVSLSGFLAAHGHPTTVVTLRGRERDFYELDAGVDRISLDLGQASRGIGKVSATLKRIRALRAVIRTQETDVVIGMVSEPAVLAILACLGLPARAVVSERNYPGRKSVDRPWALLRRLCYPLADAHVAQTRKGADWLRRHTAARRVHVVPNSVRWPLPAGAPEIRPAAFLDSGDRVVLAVGSKASQKGFDLLVEAFASAAAGRPDWHLVVLGLPPAGDAGDTDAERLRRQAEEAGVHGRVHCPGRAGNMTDWYERADIFVLSSRYEGFPNALLEAMAGGRASIAFDCETGPADIIEHDSNGLLVPAEDTPALAEALAALMDDPERRARLGRTALAVRERFAEERVLGGWKGVIDDLEPPRGGRHAAPQ